MTTIELSDVELKHLRNILATYAGEVCCGLQSWVSLNSLLVKVGCEPRSFADNETYGLIEEGVVSGFDSPRPDPGFALKSGGCFLAAFGGWTHRSDCARVFDRGGAESERGFFLDVLRHHGEIEIVPAGEA